MNIKLHPKSKNDIKNKNVNESSYRCALFIPIHLNDAISAIEIFDDVIIVGTLMGNAKLGYINPQSRTNLNNTNNTMHNNISNSLIIPQITFLIELATENISCVGFENRDVVNIAVGDFEILHMNISTDISSPNYIKIKNYPNENEHIKYCETCTCFMTSTNFLKINTEYAENNDPIEIKPVQYENKKLKNFEIVTGEIEMTNYSVPFDFDGDKFLWIDHLSPSERKICIFYTSSDKNQITITVPSNFGHISHMKLLPDNKLFLVRKNNLCEIRSASTAFTLLYKFEHLGAEVIACAIYINGTKENNDTNEDYHSLNNSNCNTSNNKNDFYLKLHNVDKMSVGSNMNIVLNNRSNGTIPKENELISLAHTYRNKEGLHSKKIKSYEEKKPDQKLFQEEEIFSIATLDYDGNFNLFQNEKEKTLFNIYDILNIEQEFKEKEFFSIGFPYYITYNKKYYVIGTDHGVFAIEKQ